MTDALPRSTHSLSAELRLTRGDFHLDVTCRVAPSGMTGVYGPSGAGKSALLRCLAGLEPQCEGTVRLGPDHWQDTARGVFVPPQRRVLLLDDPLAALDRRRKRDMLPYLARLRAELAIPMLYVSHHVDELIECDD